VSVFCVVKKERESPSVQFSASVFAVGSMHRVGSLSGSLMHAI